MSYGKLYVHETFARRSLAITAIAKHKGLDLEIVPQSTLGVDATPEYLQINPLGKVPTFVGSDGFHLTESIAIALYIASKNQKTELLGQDEQDYALILKWMLYFNDDLYRAFSPWLIMALGYMPFNKQAQETSRIQFERHLQIVEKHLSANTFLVGERITLADIYGAAAVDYDFTSSFFDREWRDLHPHFTRWFLTVRNQPILLNVAGELQLIDKAIPSMPLKPKQDNSKKPKSKPPPSEPKASNKEIDENDEDEKPAPKPKHVLDQLPPATFVLDDWKRKYSNEDTRTVALPWFWENLKFDEYSIYRVDYKYNEELTLTFMSSNLIGGFFNRLEASRKYLFGSMSVFGGNNMSIIRGAFLVRGQDAHPAFEAAPDYESYEFKQLDPTNKEDQEFLNDMWSWDKPIHVDGKEYPWADGKVFK